MKIRQRCDNKGQDNKKALHFKSERNPKVKKIEGPSEQERKKKIVLRDRAMNHSGFTGTEPIP